MIPNSRTYGSVLKLALLILKREERKGAESGVDFASFQKPSLSKALGGLALGTLSWRPQGVPTRGWA